jgi:predicted nuclease of predicted toxin-antitoxin system
MPERLRLYLDQMLNVQVAQILRKEGYDVVRASEVGQSRADDYEILQKVISENRILITLDDDFGDWAILPLSEHAGVIRLKINPTTSKNINWGIHLTGVTTRCSFSFHGGLPPKSVGTGKAVCH